MQRRSNGGGPVGVCLCVFVFVCVSVSVSSRVWVCEDSERLQSTGEDVNDYGFLIEILKIVVQYSNDPLQIVLRTL